MAPRIVVAGATGNCGAACVQALSAAGVATVALTRDAAADKAAQLKDLPHVEVVQADIADRASYAEAMKGATGAFLTCANFEGQAAAEKAFVDSAVAAGVGFFVKLGTVRSYTAMDSPVQYARYHAEAEAHLEASAGAMKWCVLCPNWFMSNHLGDIFGTLPKGIIAYPAEADSKAAAIDPRDVGEVAAKVLMAGGDAKEKLHGRKLDLSGPEEVCLGDIAKLYTEALGRPIAHVKCPPEAWVAGAVGAGFPEWLAKAILHNFTHWDAGRMQFATDADLLAVAAPKRTMAEWIKEWAPRSPPPS